jgi:hypothetical protein
MSMTQLMHEQKLFHRRKRGRRKDTWTAAQLRAMSNDEVFAVRPGRFRSASHQHS